MTNAAPPTLTVAGDVVTLALPGDTYCLDFRRVALTKSGTIFAEVTARHAEQVLHVARFDLLSQHEQEKFHQRCVSLNSSVADWQSRLQAALPGLREWVERQGGPAALRALRVTPLSTAVPERVRWLWKPYLPLGRPVALEGDPGVGKSSLVAKISAHLTSGQPFPNVLHGQTPQPFPACNVCLLSGEDDPGDTILPRIAVNGGDPARVYLLDGWHQPDGAQGPVTMQDLALLEQALVTYTPRLLVFDPVQSFFGKGVDMNNATDTRPVLDGAVALCKRYDCTPLFVRHIGKTRREKAIHAALGSIDIAAAMRAVLFLGEDPDNAQRRILAQSKSNNARLGPSLAYKIVSVDHDLLTPTGDRVTVEAPRLDWDGLSPLTATDLASPPLVDDDEVSAIDQAQEFLRELLKEGPVLYDTVTTAMKQAGIAMATLRRAKPLVGVKVRRRPGEGKNGAWEWYLPEEAPPDTPTGSPPSTHVDEQLEQVVEHQKNQEDTADSRLAHMGKSSYSTYLQQKQGDITSCSSCSSQMSQGAETAFSLTPPPGGTHDKIGEGTNSAACPQGGAHRWIRRTVDRICIRCNTTAALVDGPN